VIPPQPEAPLFLPGIDVSHHQQAVDWPAIAASGIHFCFIKATEGSSFVDPRFASNWRGAAEAGIVRGAYHFFHPGEAVTAQADLFLKTVERLETGDLPPVLDLESPQEWIAIPLANRTSLALSWLETVEQALKVRPIVYLSEAFVTNILQNPKALAQYPLWLALYTSQPSPTVPKPWSKWTFWQYTQTGTAPAIAGSVDRNHFNGTRDDLKALAFAPPQIPAPGQQATA
jgi:lysozyme